MTREIGTASHHVDKSPTARQATVQPPGAGSSATGERPGAVERRLGRYVSARMMRRYAIAVCAAALFALVVSYVTVVHAGKSGARQSDFMSYYSGAHLLVQGHGGALYDFNVLGRYERALVAPLRVRNGVLPFVYPPYFALALAPLALLPLGAAFVLWLLINLALLGATLFALRRYAALGGSGAVLLWLAALSFLPAFVALIQGQTSILILAVLAAGFLAIRSRHDALGGALLALCLVKPPYLIPLLLVLLIQGRRRALAGFALAALVLLVIPIFFFGPSIDLKYLSTLYQATGWHNQYGYDARGNQSLWGLCQLLLAGRAATVAGVLLSLAAVLGLTRYASRVSFDRAFGMGVVVALLVAPHVLIHDLSLLILPVAIAICVRGPASKGLTVLLSLGYVAITIDLQIASVAPLQLSAIALTALALWFFRTRQPHERLRSPLPVSRDGVRTRPAT